MALGRTGLSVLQSRKKGSWFSSVFIKEGNEAINKDGAEALTLECMSLGFQNVDKKLQEKLGVQVLNPVKVAVKMAELLVDLRLSHSKKVFKKPNYSAS